MKNRVITVENIDISVSKEGIEDYICISDLTKAKGGRQEAPILLKIG